MTLGAARRPNSALPHGHISLMPVCTHPVLHLLHFCRLDHHASPVQSLTRVSVWLPTLMCVCVCVFGRRAAHLIVFVAGGAPPPPPPTGVTHAPGPVLRQYPPPSRAGPALPPTHVPQTVSAGGTSLTPGALGGLHLHSSPPPPPQKCCHVGSGAPPQSSPQGGGEGVWNPKVQGAFTGAAGVLAHVGPWRHAAGGHGRTFVMERKHAGASSGQPNLHIMAVAVPPGILYLWADAPRMPRHPQYFDGCCFTRKFFLV